MSNCSLNPARKSAQIMWVPILFLLFNPHAIQPATGQSTKSQVDFEGLSKLLEPVINETTLLFAHVDTNQLDESSLAKKAKTLLWPQNADSERLKLMIDHIGLVKKEIARCGGRFVFVTASLFDMENEPVIAIPVADRSNTAELIKLLEPFSSMGFQVQKLNSRLLIVARSSAVVRIANQELVPRSDIERILRKSVAGIASVNFVPSADHLKVVRELTPSLNPPFSSISGELVADSMQSAFLRLNQFEPLDVEVRINSKSDQAAARLKQVIINLRDQLKPKEPEILIIKGIMAQLDLKQVERGLSLSVGEKEEAVWLAIKPFFEAAQKRVHQGDLTNRLRNIVIGLHNFHDANRMFPDLGVLQDQGKPQLSWRVHILPYLGEAALYDQFKLDEPWDSEHNKKLIPKMPELYLVQGRKESEGRTRFVMPRGKKYFAKPFVHDQDAKPLEKVGRRMREILDGTSNTVAIIPVASQHAVVWTKPEDWTPPAQDLIQSVREPNQKTLTFASVDGAVHRIDFTSLDEKKFRAWLTIAAGDYTPRR